jgi:dihydroorotate dehydrogenase electron transfer subunit
MSKSKVSHRVQLAPDIFKMTFETDNCKFSRPGQYALIRTGGECRPYQVCDYDSDRYTIVFRASDKFGRELADVGFGGEVETVTGLGNGFDVDLVPDESVLVADSMGVIEMLELARSLLIRGKKFKMILGFRTRDTIFMMDSFRNICNELEVLTLDGSNGREGMASEAVRNAEYVCASGTPAMLKDLASRSKEGQFSLSSMMHVSPEENGDFEVGTTEGMVSCSKVGPVFDKNRVDWDTLSLERWNRSTY